MKSSKRSPALIYCEAAFNTPNGKTAHGLIRLSNRYDILGVIDSRYANEDSGKILDGQENHIPIWCDLDQALNKLKKTGRQVSHFIIGLAPDGGRMSSETRTVILQAIKNNLNIDSGLHDFLTEDETIVRIAAKKNIVLRDIRKPPDRKKLHFFSGKIKAIDSFRIAILGVDSAIGKRTTAWLLVQALQDKGFRTEMIGTGQTAWLQGVTYGIVLDSIVNDFVTGEIEHIIWKAWHETRAQFLILEGQGGLLNPGFPGGYEILAAASPDAVILQHAPARKYYDGFPGYPLHPLRKQIEAIEVISGKKVLAITLNHENLEDDQISTQKQIISQKSGLPVFDLFVDGTNELANLIIKGYDAKNRKR